MDLAHPNYGVNVENPKPVKYQYESTGGGPGNEEIRTQTFDQWNLLNIKKTYLLKISFFLKNENLFRETHYDYVHQDFKQAPVTEARLD